MNHLPPRIPARCFVLMSAFAFGWFAAMPVEAALTDLQTVRTIVTRAQPPLCTGLVPVEGQLVCLSVVVRNLGPDPYIGTSPGKPGPRIAAGRIRATVDIDEPTKPWEKPGTLPMPQMATFTQDFAVTIAPGDSVRLEFGVVGWTGSAGTHGATATCIAQDANIDPNPANNETFNLFTVLGRVPAMGWIGLAAGGLLLAGVGVWQLRRRAVRV